MREHFQKIRRRRVEGDLQGSRIDRARSDLLRRRFAGIYLLGVFDDVEHRSVFGPRRRILEASEGIDEVVGGDGVAIGPNGPFAQLEGVDRAVVGQCPASRRTRNEVGLGVRHDQPLEQVAQDIRLVDGGDLMRIERFRLRCIAAVVDHLGAGGARQHSDEREPRG